MGNITRGTQQVSSETTDKLKFDSDNRLMIKEDPSNEDTLDFVLSELQEINDNRSNLWRAGWF